MFAVHGVFLCVDFSVRWDASDKDEVSILSLPSNKSYGCSEMFQLGELRVWVFVVKHVKFSYSGFASISKYIANSLMLDAGETKVNFFATAFAFARQCSRERTFFS